MELNYAELSLIMGAVMAGFRLLEVGLNFIVKKLGNGKKDTAQDIELAIIKEKILSYEKNHFPSIEKRFDNLECKIDKVYDILIKK